MDNNLSFSKIVATPTLNAWSQAYNAGKLFVVLSLEKTQELTQNSESLNMLGKNLLERLEQEFFVIEDKNLESIKKAVLITFKDGIENVNISFAAGALVNKVLYLFCLGDAKVFIKRDNNLGIALDSENVIPKNVASSSGFLKEQDLIVLATDAFSKIIPQDDLIANLNENEPSEIAESLAPKIHKAEDGKISAIIIKYGKLKAEEVIGEGIVAEEEIEQEEKSQEQVSPFYKYLSLLKSKFRKPNIKTLHAKKLFLVTAIIIVGILILSVFLTVQQQNNAKIHALFEKIYPQALKKYDEGQGLVEISKNLSRDSFLSAQKILNDNKEKFLQKSKENLQIQDLLKKIDSGLTMVSPIDASGLDRSKLSIAVANGSGIEGTAGKAATILRDLGYNVASTENADNFGYKGATIKVKKEKGNFLNLLKKDLTKDYAITTTSSDLSSDFPTDSLVIIGK